MYALPIARRPRDGESLLDNQAEFDKESSRSQFWSVYGSAPKLLGDISGEAYLFGLHENDLGEIETRD